MPHPVPIQTHPARPHTHTHTHGRDGTTSTRTRPCDRVLDRKSERTKLNGTILPLGTQPRAPALWIPALTAADAPTAREWPAARHVVHVPSPFPPGRPRSRQVDSRNREAGTLAPGQRRQLDATTRPRTEITRGAGRAGASLLPFAAALARPRKGTRPRLPTSPPPPIKTRARLSSIPRGTRSPPRGSQAHHPIRKLPPLLLRLSPTLRKARSGPGPPARAYTQTQTQAQARLFVRVPFARCTTSMAQRDKKEEPTELRAPEITLCANNCGFPGNPATQNLCQSCFSAATASRSSSPSSPTSSSSASAVSQPRPAALVDAAAVELLASADAAAVGQSMEVVAAAPAATAARSSAVNRCSSCRKRVGLTGFRCRCGELFCGAHRYSDRHGCSYDYKGAGRDAIARENPVVRAAKIVRF